MNSQAIESFVLKGGVLLAVYDARRPTRDIDVSGQNFSNDTSAVPEMIRTVLAQPNVDDGWEYGNSSAGGYSPRGIGLVSKHRQPVLALMYAAGAIHLATDTPEAGFDSFAELYLTRDWQAVVDALQKRDAHFVVVDSQFALPGSGELSAPSANQLPLSESAVERPLRGDGAKRATVGSAAAALDGARSLDRSPASVRS